MPRSRLVLALMISALALAACTHRTDAETDPPRGLPQTRASFDAALQRATAEQRVLLVVADRTTCRSCDEFRQSTLRHPAVASWLDRRGLLFVVDVSHDVELRDSLGLDRLPTMVTYLQGAEFERSAGNLRPEELVLWLQDVDDGRTSVGRLSQMLVYAGRERDAGLRFDYARALLRAGAHDEAARELVWLSEHLEELDDAEGLSSSTIEATIEEVERVRPATKAIFDGSRNIDP